ncbi:amidase [Nocardia sp. NPDC024068]|uniref:amidase n=1 Tax=Nocardia sp. NPDC024068 TaxID=3157197 RepID=UPI0033DEB5AF
MTARLSRRAFVRAAGAGLFAAAAGPALTARADPLALPDPTRITATDPALLPAVEAASLLQAKRLHPRELLDACLRRSAEFDGPINAWVRTYPEIAYDQAEQAGQRLAAGGAPLLCGLPLALKDLFAVSGLPVTASSRVLAGNISAGDATVWRRLRDQGVVLLGHTHTDEFALGLICPQVGNPWDTAAIVGGSSGGNAAALAARFTPLALGTDTGGSLRIPSARAGVSAIKPTYGQVSQYGVIPSTASRDHIGPMARSIADAALLLSAISGADPRDRATATAAPVPAGGYPLIPAGGAKPLAATRFGVDRGMLAQLPDALGTLAARFLDLVTGLGGTLRDITMPTLPSGQFGDSLEVGRYHRQWADQLALYRPDTAVMVGNGLASLSAPGEYLTFERDRTRFQHDYNRLLAENGLDAIILPTVVRDRQARTDVLDNLFDISAPVTWANYAGAPVLSLPVGRSAATGLPFGMQLGGMPWSEPGLIAIGLELQAAEPAWQEMPELVPGARTLPDTGRQAPGPGPDPTGTLVEPPPAAFTPTTGTG